MVYYRPIYDSDFTNACLLLDECIIFSCHEGYMNRNVRECAFWHMPPAKTQISLRINVVWSIRVFGVRKKELGLIGLFKMCQVNNLMRVRERAGWYEYWLGTQIPRYIFVRCGLYENNTLRICVYLNSFYGLLWTVMFQQISLCISVRSIKKNQIRCRILFGLYCLEMALTS